MASDTAPITDVSVINLNSSFEFKDAPPILVQITADEWLPGKAFPDGRVGAPQLHTAYKPLEYALGGQTGAYHNYTNLSESKKSEMSMWVAAWNQAMGTKRPDGTPWPFGKGELIGTVLWVVRKDLDFGTNRQTGEKIKKEGVVLPQRTATPEEAARATSGPVVTPAAPAYTDDDLNKALDLMAGKAQLKVMKDVANASKNHDITPELANAILNGNVTRVLTERGLAQVDGDGMITRLNAREPELAAAA